MEDVLKDNNHGSVNIKKLKRLDDEVNLTEMVLRIEKRKKVGIRPDNLKNNDVRISFQEKTLLPTKGDEEDEDSFTSKPFS